MLEKCHVSSSLSTQDMFVGTGPKDSFGSLPERQCLVCTSELNNFQGTTGRGCFSDVITGKTNELLYFVSDPREASPYQVRRASEEGTRKGRKPGMYRISY